MESIFLLYSREEYRPILNKHAFTIHYYQLSPRLSNRSPFEVYQSYRLSIDMKPFDPSNNYPSASLEFGDLELAISTKVDFQMSPKGCGLGSIILNHLIAWGKYYYPEARIRPLYLSTVDESNIENKHRRDRLYSKIGLINYSGQKPLKDLTPVCNYRDFEVVHLHEYLNTLVSEQLTLTRELKRITTDNNSLISRNNELSSNLTDTQSRNKYLIVAVTILGMLLLSSFWGGVIDSKKNLSDRATLNQKIYN